MQQISLPLDEETSFSQWIGHFFPYLFRPKILCRGYVVKKEIATQFVPTGGGFAPGMSKQIHVGYIKVGTTDGTAWMKVQSSFYETVKAGDHVPIWYQKSRRFDFDREIKAKPIRP